MITVNNDLPDNVLGFSANGKITGADYETILIPALYEKLKTYNKIRVLYHLGSDFTGFDMGSHAGRRKDGDEAFIFMGPYRNDFGS